MSPLLLAFLASIACCMFDITQLAAIVMIPSSLLSSLLFLAANWMCRGHILSNSDTCKTIHSSQGIRYHGRGRWVHRVLAYLLALR
jgi:hypothetical protein